MSINKYLRPLSYISQAHLHHDAVGCNYNAYFMLLVMGKRSEAWIVWEVISVARQDSCIPRNDARMFRDA